MTDIILTINAGSSSVKFSVYEIAEGELAPLAVGLIDGIGGKATFAATKTSGWAWCSMCPASSIRACRR